MHQRRWARGLALPTIITALVIALAACGQITTPSTTHPQAPTLVSPQALDWQVTTVANGDSTSGAHATHPSVALDSAGNPHIAYVFLDTSGIHVMYASYDPTNTENPWSTETVATDNNITPYDVLSLALDKDNHPHIAWTNRGESSSDLMYASPGSSCTNGWCVTTVVTGQYISGMSLAVDGNGDPHVAYTGSDSSGTAYLKYVSYDSSTSTWTSPETVIPGATNEGFGYPSLALDSNGNPHISAYDMNYDAGTGTGTLVYSSRSLNTDPHWTTVTADSGGSTYTMVGQDDSLALDGAGNPHISYLAANEGFDTQLRYTTRDSDGTWHTPTAIETGGSDFLFVGINTSIALDPVASGVPHISYIDTTDSSQTPVLRYAWYDAEWHTDSVDTGSFAITRDDSLAIDTTTNHAYIGFIHDMTTTDPNYGDLMLAVGPASSNVEPAPVISSFRSSPSSLSSWGGSVTLSWSAQYASSFSVSVSPSLAGFPTTTTGTSVDASLPANPTSSENTYTFTLTATGSGGNTEATASVKVETPEESINDLITAINDLVTSDILKDGQANGLIHPLDNALRSLSKDDASDAYNQLQDFISDVQAKTPTPLKTQIAEGLITTAENIESSLGY